MGVGTFSSMPPSHLKGHENFSSDCLSASPQRLYSAVLGSPLCVREQGHFMGDAEGFLCPPGVSVVDSQGKCAPV